MEKQRMLVSIIIPAYNTEKYIRECIKSCFRQTYRNIEIICVNDGSKDNTGKIIDSMLSEDRRLKVIHQENGGVTAARMAGTKTAQGNYVFYLDSDDVLTDHCIATLVQNSDNGTTDMITGHRKEIFNPNSLRRFEAG
jgi:glycosyltransferase involved in cell wall biosynthesis